MKWVGRKALDEKVLYVNWVLDYIHTSHQYEALFTAQSTIDSEGFKGGTRGAPIMPRDAFSRTANVTQNRTQNRLHKSDTKLAMVVLSI